MESAPGSQTPIRILLIEDSVDAIDALAQLLRITGADVVTTGSAAEAVKAVAAQDFDVVVSDLGLPDVPGDVVIRHILATATRRPRVVVMTGRDESWHRRARDAGADAVLVKPFNWSELIASLCSPSADGLSVATPGKAA
jgi:two-component system CheB/CheR fusion protein